MYILQQWVLERSCLNGKPSYYYYYISSINSTLCTVILLFKTDALCNPIQNVCHANKAPWNWNWVRQTQREGKKEKENEMNLSWTLSWAFPHMHIPLCSRSGSHGQRSEVTQGASYYIRDEKKKGGAMTSQDFNRTAQYHYFCKMNRPFCFTAHFTLRYKSQAGQWYSQTWTK